MSAPEPIEGYEWVRARDLRDRLTNQQVRGLYLREDHRPRDRVIDGERWVALPEGCGT